MVPEVDPTVDYAFKHVFGQEQRIPLLIDLIDSVRLRRPGKPTKNLQILNPFNDKEALDDKLSILDIKARDLDGNQFNLEMQMLARAYLLERLLYYWARFHQQQLREGEDFGELRPTLLICFVNDIVFPDTPEFASEFELVNRVNDLLLTDQIRLWIIELPKFKKTLSELSEPLDYWLYFLRHARELDSANLPAPLNQHAFICQAMEDLVKLSQTEEELQRYESRWKSQLDELSARRWAERQLQEGLEQGREQGERHALLRIVHRYEERLGRSPTSESELAAKTLMQLQELADRLEDELFSRPQKGPE